MSERSSAEIAAERADWEQVVQNGGPPCFHIIGNHFCLRAKAWVGHDAGDEGAAYLDHKYVSMRELLEAERSRARGRVDRESEASRHACNAGACGSAAAISNRHIDSRGCAQIWGTMKP